MIITSLLEKAIATATAGGTMINIINCDKISQNIVKVNLFTLLYSTSLLYLGEQMGSGHLGNRLKIWTDRSICNVFLSTVCMYEERITE